MRLPKRFIFSRKKAGHLCYMSARFGYKAFSDWIINNVPEASYSISSYISKHPDEYEDFIKNGFKDSDYCLDKAEKMLNRLNNAEKEGYEPDEFRYLK